MACLICHADGGRDADAICPACQRQGYEEACPRDVPCYYDPAGELHRCPAHEQAAAEDAEERAFAAYHGGVAPESWYRK